MTGKAAAVRVPVDSHCVPPSALPLEGTIMKLDPDEKELLESFERGEWKPTSADEVARMRELATRSKRR